MSSTVGSITGIKPEAEPDGGHMIQVADFGSEPFEVWIRPDQIGQLISTLQRNVISRAMAETQTPTFPQLTLEASGLAHQSRVTALMVATAETGSLVFVGSDDSFRALRSEVDRLLQHRSGSSETH